MGGIEDIISKLLHPDRCHDLETVREPCCHLGTHAFPISPGCHGDPDTVEHPVGE